MSYELYYWPMIPGRGEYVRLVLVEAGVDWVDVAKLPEDQGGGAAVVVAEIGMHVGAADADGIDPDDRLSRARCGFGFVAQLHGPRAGIDQGLHFAVYPPST